MPYVFMHLSAGLLLVRSPVAPQTLCTPKHLSLFLCVCLYPLDFMLFVSIKY